MAPSATLHILTRGDLRAGDPYARWQDPDRIAAMSDGARRAHLSNPLAGDDSEAVQIIGVQGDRIIGRLDLLAGEIRVNGQPQRLLVGSNLYVPQEHRNTLMGVLLIMKSQGLGAVAALGPSQQALGVYQKLKWIDLVLNRFILLRRSRAVMEKLLKPAWLGRALAPLADVALAVHRAVVLWLIGAIRTAGLRVEAADRFPESLESRFADRTEPIQFHRSARWINWALDNAFTDDPRARRRLFLIRTNNGEVAGYFLVKVRFFPVATHRQFKDVLLGSIQDWMIFPPASISPKQVAILASRELSRLGADAIELNLPPQQVGGWLRWMGFARVGDVHFVFKAPPASPLGQVRNAASIQQWWCRPGEGDNLLI